MPEPLTPVEIETKLRSLVTELTKAQQILARARDAETDAEVAYKHAKLIAAEKAPKPRRGEVSVGEREEHIDRISFDMYRDLAKARTRRENAQDYLRILRDQAEIVRSLGASVRTAYGMAGVNA